jgi:hypothetical protein
LHNDFSAERDWSAGGSPAMSAKREFPPHSSLTTISIMAEVVCLTKLSSLEKEVWQPLLLTGWFV